jgi:hypothetical protein
MRNIKRASVLEFGKLIAPSAGQSEYLQEEEIWGEDPVHYTQKGYKMAAAGLESLIYEKKSEEKEEEAKPNPPKKPKLDLTKNRPAWVLGSVAEAVRSEGPSGSGRGRGSAAPRGGNRGGFVRGGGRGHSGPPRGGWVQKGGGTRGRGPNRGRGRGRPY